MCYCLHGVSLADNNWCTRICGRRGERAVRRLWSDVRSDEVRECWCQTNTMSRMSATDHHHHDHTVSQTGTCRWLVQHSFASRRHHRTAFFRSRSRWPSTVSKPSQTRQLIVAISCHGSCSACSVLRSCCFRSAAITELRQPVDPCGRHAARLVFNHRLCRQT